MKKTFYLKKTLISCCILGWNGILNYILLLFSCKTLNIWAFCFAHTLEEYFAFSTGLSNCNTQERNFMIRNIFNCKQVLKT